MLQPKGLLFTAFNLKWPRRLGQISYGFYVFHDLFHGVWSVLASHFPQLEKRTTTSVLGLVGTTMISYFSFRFFEKPFLRLKERYKA